MALAEHSASGTAAAFAYQFERALHWLAKGPSGSIVGIETDDDVAIRGEHGHKTLEQVKHSIQAGSHSFGDRSRDLWNTLATWVEAMQGGELVPDKVRLMMVTNKVVLAGIAHQISAATTPNQVEACVLALKSAAKNSPKEIESLCQRVLAPSADDSLRIVVRHCELLDKSTGSAGEDLRKETISFLQLPEWGLNDAGSIADELLGWLATIALKAWQANTPFWIKRDNFANQLHAILDRRKRVIQRELSENLLPIADEALGTERARTFVKQLHLVTDDEDHVDVAIRDFIRCSQEKTRLSMEGNVTDEDWLAFEAALLTRWQRIRIRVMGMKKSHPEEVIGFEILCDTTMEYREKLAGIDTEQCYLTAGTYHRMADAIAIGWHPRYGDLLEGKK